ncbi:MAG: SusD/RagB family nutrient-binding outer membrane lipoprotein [Bacteroides sp.]|nr:SusD/RagB family nutrient-binding outer membrane lipoprotein [Bacteroides sp.]
MKTRILNVFLLLMLLVSIPSCNLFPEPEEPDYKAELETLLPGTQYLVAYFSGTDYGRFQNQWMQQLAGIRGVHGAVDIYNLQESYLDDPWNLYYKSTYPNLYGIVANADELGSKSYRGIARILLAWNLGMMTDAWGDIPNTSSLDYISGFYPPYDTQSDIYMYFLGLLNEAIVDLNQAIGTDTIQPGEDHDLIYGGDMQQWIKAAHAIRLRYTLRLAHQAGNYDIAANSIIPGNMFSSNQDDMEYYFTGNQVNPHFYYDNTVRNTRMGKYFVDKLKETGDPRLPVFVRKSTTDNEYRGSAPGENNFNASFIGTSVADQQAPVLLMTYVEQKFIEAEVYQRTGQQALADEAFELAVKASLQKYNVSDPEWEAVHAEIENVSLQQIIEAKYIALFLNPEVFSDWRRTGFPQLTPYQGSTSGSTSPQLPRRFIYPADETIHNSPNIPEDVTIFDRVWWDVER